MAETDLGRAVVAYLRNFQWDVHQEVKGYGGVADIVATFPPWPPLEGPEDDGARRVRIVELKKSLGFAVIAQARRWLAFGHWVHIAVPWTRTTDDGRRLALEVCERFGIGVLEVQGVGPKLDDHALVECVTEAAPARIQRRAHVETALEWLCPETRSYLAAGAARQGPWSPFKATCQAIRNHLAAHPDGVPTKELVASIRHHYARDSTARGTLVMWAGQGKVPGVYLEHDQRGRVIWKLDEPRREGRRGA